MRSCGLQVHCVQIADCRLLHDEVIFVEVTGKSFFILSSAFARPFPGVHPCSSENCALHDSCLADTMRTGMSVGFGVHVCAGADDEAQDEPPEDSVDSCFRRRLPRPPKVAHPIVKEGACFAA